MILNIVTWKAASSRMHRVTFNNVQYLHGHGTVALDDEEYT